MKSMLLTTLCLDAKRKLILMAREMAAYVLNILYAVRISLCLDAKRKLILMVGEMVALSYQWCFSYLVFGCNMQANSCGRGDEIHVY